MADTVTVTIDRSILPPDLYNEPMQLAARMPDWIQHNRDMYDRIAAAQVKARDAWAALGTVMHEPPIYWQSSVAGALYPMRRLGLIEAFTVDMNEYQALLVDYPTSYARICEARDKAVADRIQAEQDAYLATLRRSGRVKRMPDYKGDLRVDYLNRLDMLESDHKDAQDSLELLRTEYKECIAERDRLQEQYVTAWAPYAESVANFRAQELWKKVKVSEPDEAVEMHRALKKAIYERKAAIRDYAVTMKEVGDELNQQWRNVCKCRNKIIRLKERAQ